MDFKNHFKWNQRIKRCNEWWFHFGFCGWYLQYSKECHCRQKSKRGKKHNLEGDFKKQKRHSFHDHKRRSSGRWTPQRNSRNYLQRNCNFRRNSQIRIATASSNQYQVQGPVIRATRFCAQGFGENETCGHVSCFRQTVKKRPFMGNWFGWRKVFSEKYKITGNVCRWTKSHSIGFLGIGFQYEWSCCWQEQIKFCHIRRFDCTTPRPFRSNRFGRYGQRNRNFIIRSISERRKSDSNRRTRFFIRFDFSLSKTWRRPFMGNWFGRFGLSGINDFSYRHIYKFCIIRRLDSFYRWPFMGNRFGRFIRNKHDRNWNGRWP